VGVVLKLLWLWYLVGLVCAILNEEVRLWIRFEMYLSLFLTRICFQVSLYRREFIDLLEVHSWMDRAVLSKAIVRAWSGEWGF
jgi:hypothetical protein